MFHFDKTSSNTHVGPILSNVDKWKKTTYRVVSNARWFWKDYPGHPLCLGTFIIMYFWQEGSVVLGRFENNPVIIPFLSKLTSCERFTHLKVLKFHLRKTSWLSKSNLVKDSLYLFTDSGEICMIVLSVDKLSRESAADKLLRRTRLSHLAVKDRTSKMARV